LGLGSATGLMLGLPVGLDACDRDRGTEFGTETGLDAWDSDSAAGVETETVPETVSEETVSWSDGDRCAGGVSRLEGLAAEVLKALEAAV